MGAVSHRQNKIVHFSSETLDVNQLRFLSVDDASSKQRKFQPYRISPFHRLAYWEMQLESVPQQPLDSCLLRSAVYFRQKEDLNAYMSTLFALKQLYKVHLFQDLQVKTETKLLCLMTKQTLGGVPWPLNKSELLKNIPKFMNLLIFVAGMVTETEGMYIEPEEIVEVGGEFYLRTFSHGSVSAVPLLLGFICWLYSLEESFEECLQQEGMMIHTFHEQNVYLKELYSSLRDGRVPKRHLVAYLRKARAKHQYLDGNFDSMHACYKAKRQKQHSRSPKEWLLAKRNNEVYFFNVEDMHVCQGRIIRKRKKISLQNTHIVFTPEDFEVSFILEGTKNLVRTTEFELEDSFTISDIEIKYKFPFKLRNPMLFQRGREIYFYDQMILRYSIDDNKVYQLTKKIGQCLCLVPSNECAFLAVRSSIDIFMHGIKVCVGGEIETLVPSGNPNLSSEISGLKMDIKHVEFCTEVYRGVFLMFAHKNLWVLDINFKCFFSYAPLERVKDYCKGRGGAEHRNQFVFEILGQPFPVNWLPHQDGINVSVQGDILHVIGLSMGKLVYLKYRMLFEAGLLHLLKHRPLYSIESDSIVEEGSEQTRQHLFNLYNQNFDAYKAATWVYRGSHFLNVENLSLSQQGGHTRVSIESEAALSSLKEVIESNRRTGRSWSHFERIMLLHRLFSIYGEIYRNGYSHRNFNLANLWITHGRELKVSGWSEPQRNWQISDYKDFLMVCFNVVTQSAYDKFSDKILGKHEEELAGFPVLADKVKSGLRVKTAEKRAELEKSMLQIREYLGREIHKCVVESQHSNFIFTFEHNTPRFSLLNILEGRIKKMVGVVEGATEEFTFRSTDKYVWREEELTLYIFTNNYQMLQAKMSLSDYKEETVTLEEYEYLPNNIIECSFAHTPQGMFAVGGIARNSKKKVNYNTTVYHFDRDKLTWEGVAELDQPRTNPRVIPSESGQHLYIIGGQLDLETQNFQPLLFDTLSKEVKSMVDRGMMNPLRSFAGKKANRIFQVSEEYNIFLLWAASSTSFTIRLFSSLICGFDIALQGKIYMDECTELPTVSVSYLDGCVHFLRPYGKYTKISLGSLEAPSVSHKTLYSNEK